MTCRHGSPPDKCRICSLEKEVQSQKEEIEQLSTKISELTADHIVKGYEIAIDTNTQQTEQLKKLNESIEKRLNLPEIESLKAIIDAKNEDIEDMKKHLGEEMAGLEFERDSLKAITELAVKDLKMICESSEDAITRAFAKDTISEIERLQNG